METWAILLLMLGLFKVLVLVHQHLFRRLDEGKALFLYSD